MLHVDPRPEATTADLVREVIDETKELIEVEVALARDEINQEIARAKEGAIALGTAAAAALLGVVMILVAIALAISRGPIPALAIGIVLLVVALVVGFVGYGRVPRRPLERTRGRLLTDARILAESIKGGPQPETRPLLKERAVS